MTGVLAGLKWPVWPVVECAMARGQRERPELAARWLRESGGVSKWFPPGSEGVDLYIVVVIFVVPYTEPSQIPVRDFAAVPRWN